MMVRWSLLLAGVLLAGVQPVGAQQLATPATATSPALPPEISSTLSPWGMFLGADGLVQAVMVGLFLASVATWTIWLAKSVEIVIARRRIARSLSRLVAAASLEAVCAKGAQLDRRVLAMAHAAALVMEEERDGGAWPTDDQIATRLDRHRLAAGRGLARGTGILSTIGAVAPFVGLFGTVWGIMNSFVGIAQSQTTNLAVVAPGIAEALLATGAGLAAAIPAVIAHNLLRRSSVAVKVLLGDAAVEIRRLAARMDARAHLCLGKIAAE